MMICKSWKLFVAMPAWRALRLNTLFIIINTNDFEHKDCINTHFKQCGASIYRNIVSVLCGLQNVVEVTLTKLHTALYQHAVTFTFHLQKIILL